MELYYQGFQGGKDEMSSEMDFSNSWDQQFEQDYQARKKIEDILEKKQQMQYLSDDF